MRSLKITYNYEAGEWWRDEIAHLGARRLFVRISPTKGGAPFDAFLYGVDGESDLAGAVKIIRATADRIPVPGAEVETVIAEKIHVY